MDISIFCYLVDYPFVIAADLFAISQTDRGRTTLFRSHTIPAMDNVDLVLRFDCSPAIRNARGAAGFEQIRRALAWPRARHYRAIIKTPLPRRPSPVQARSS